MGDVIFPENQDDWKAMRSGDCRDTFTANPTDIFFRECVATHTRNTIGGNQLSSKKILDVQKRFVSAVKRIVAMIERKTSWKFSSKGQEDRLW